MASTYSTDLSLELVTTGEKAGLWGAITNTNLQLLQTAASGYVEVTLSSGTTTLSLADGSSSANGKNLYIKVTGTLSGNSTLAMPASTTGGNANRVFFVEDGTTRGGAGDSYTVTLITTGQSGGVPLPEGATALVYSRGSVPATTLGMLDKGFTTVTAASKTAYTAVPGDQIGVDTVANIVTITLPAGSVGDEIVIMDVSASNGFATNKCVVAPDGSENIQGANSSIDLTTNNQSVTLFYTGASKGWQLKTNTA
jgi:hypothetical protein